jgi:hypothetical protein
MTAQQNPARRRLPCVVAFHWLAAALHPSRVRGCPRSRGDRPTHLVAGTGAGRRLIISLVVVAAVAASAAVAADLEPVISGARLAAATASAVGGSGPAGSRQRPIEDWTLAGRPLWLSRASAGQGVATLSLPGGSSRVITRGDASVPAELRQAGWWHVGDPDSRNGYLLDAYQGRLAQHAKLFVLTTPAGQRVLYRHRLAEGEMLNNSFVAIAPSGDWFVTGEWRTITRLLVFAMPGRRNDPPSPAVDLPLTSVITLTHPMRNVQGCAFTTATELICATDDRRRDLYPIARQLLWVRLSGPVSGRAQAGTPSLLAAVPHPPCPGADETEGLDVTGNQMLLMVNAGKSCRGTTFMYRYLDHGEG